jgi:hypothetical protein
MAKRRRKSSKQSVQLNPAKKLNINMAESHVSHIDSGISIDSIKQVMTESIQDMVKKI